MSGVRIGHAVVLGAGVAGLAAAAALSPRCDAVTVVDRDDLPDAPRPRRGVPQGEHAHALLAVGGDALEELFPGLTAELFRHGAVGTDVGRDLLLWQLGGFRAGFDSGVRVIGVSRPMLEWRLRRQVLARPNVTLRTGAVAALRAGPGDRVDTVELAGGGRIEAGLVVDATGRGARSDRWLASLGFAAPPVETVGVRIGYATRLLRRHPDDLPQAKTVAIAPTPPGDRRFGVAMSVENDRWLVTLGGFHGDHPPTDDRGFREFAGTLAHPLVAELLARAEPLGEAVSYRFPASRRRHFERLRRYPAGYVAIGDAICSFNPVYGQGMTIAALQALALGRAVDRYPGSGHRFVAAFHRAASRLADASWELARSADFWYPQTQGRRPVALGLRTWYMRQAIIAAQHSAAVHRTLIQVQHLQAAASVMARPGTLVAVLRHARQSTPVTEVVSVGVSG